MGVVDAASQVATDASDRPLQEARIIKAVLVNYHFVWCGRRDLNPGSQAWKACVLNQLDDDRLTLVS